MPDRIEALEGIANHIQKFWDPRMRKAFLTYVDDPNQKEVKPIVLAAIAEHRALIEPLAE